MESNLVNLDIDESRYSLPPQKAIAVIEHFFKNQLSKFNLIDKYNDPTGYYGLKYAFENIIVFVGSGRGFLESYIDVNGEVISLKDYDSKTKLIKSANEKNITYTLKFIKNFLD